MDDGTIGALPFRESGICTSGDVPKRGTGDDLEERVVHFFEIRLKFTLDIDDESGRDCGEQTGLLPTWGSHDVEAHGENAHEYQRGIQIFIVPLDKVAVIIVRCLVELIVELDSLVASGSEARKESRQGFNHSIFDTENGRKQGG